MSSGFPPDNDASAYDYALPEGSIARYPPTDRDGGRLLVCDDVLQDSLVRDLPEWLCPGDLLVVNDTRVLPARLWARRKTGGRVEVLLLGSGPGPVEALLRPGSRLKVGERLCIGDKASVRLLERHEDGRWTVETDPEPQAVMEAQGVMPLPPYLRRPAEESDSERYQTIFADQPGAVAAPTAGLHLTEELLSSLGQRGVGLARITLHVGMGTFRPLRTADLERGELHPEWYRVPRETVEAVRTCRETGGRVIAVGTTSVRTLEAATPAGSRLPQAGEGVTRLFLREGHRFRCVDGLVTNFHLPRTSLLMLVCAFGGRKKVLSAYGHAVSRGYRFYSYGDAMLLLPGE
jgi:S-adenosylmethionine:tRNA ribosyltransferase-isomerase